MIVYRLTRLPYCNDLSGYGASMSPVNRWNSKGVSMLYTAANRALAFAEVFVHLKLHRIPSDMMMVTLRLPEDTAVVQVQLEEDIRDCPLHITQKLGDDFVKNPFQFAMSVPSYVIEGEHNILINPEHPSIEKIIIENIQPFSFDERLFKR